MLRLLALAAGGLALLSAVADAQGFLHASRIWDGQRLVPEELVKSAAGYIVGFIIYWGAVVVFERIGVHAPEVQTVIWFVFTIIGVGLLSGRFLRWQATEQIVGAAVLVGLSWLLVRTAEA
jgi:hypothetical protein